MLYVLLCRKDTWPRSALQENCCALCTLCMFVKIYQQALRHVTAGNTVHNTQLQEASQFRTM